MWPSEIIFSTHNYITVTVIGIIIMENQNNLYVINVIV